MEEKLTYKIRGAIFEVHNLLGPGLYEECYHKALLNELQLRGIKAESKVKLPVKYKGIEIKEAYEVDILVEDEIILELKSVTELTNAHYKQVQNYLHLSDRFLGILVNFNCVCRPEIA
ncbi:MAG: GxxExxY protein [Bacteroidales bacterium]|nr:GxxExxY protein [Bacteroidales bacterium]